MIVVCDASPLIFLGKLNRLGLLPALLPGDLLVPDDVEREVLSGFATPAEDRLLRSFLKEHCRVVRIRPSGFKSAALSRPDRTVLTLARRESADHILSDDRLLRDVGEVEGLTPIGTLVILLKSLKADLLTTDQVRSDVHALVREHGFRMGIELYEAIMRMIDEE